MEAFVSFATPPIMVIEILIAEFMFAAAFRRRQFFWLRFIGYTVAAIIIALWTEIAYALITEQGYIYGGGVSNLAQSIFNFAFYLAIFIMAIAIATFSYKESFSRILLCCSGAYATQHIARNISALFYLIPSMNRVSPYALLIEAAVFSVVCAFVWFLFARALKTHETYDGNNVRKVTLSLIVILVCIVMSRLTSDNPERNFLSVLAESAYAIVSCLILLISQFGVVENDSMHREVDSMAELLRQERKQYELSKETIQLINIKCHDLKHQISALRHNASEESIAEIEHAIMIYDCAVKTGNDVLDVILTEKKLQCENKNIQMTCVANGKLISFMEHMDIYSLFGNALSNAIESVSNVPDEQNRCVGVNIANIAGMLVVHIENYFEGELTVSDGLPVTKKDNCFHGFGMKSMQRISRKYGGELTVSVSGKKFNLDAVLPIPK